MQKNRRFNAGKQFRRLPVYSFRVCRKIRELLPGKNATRPGGIMGAASPGKMAGNTTSPAENPVLPHMAGKGTLRADGKPGRHNGRRKPGQNDRQHLKLRQRTRYCHPCRNRHNAGIQGCPTCPPKYPVAARPRRQRTYRTPDQVHREVQNTAIRVAGVKIFYSERPAVMLANTSRYAAGAGCRIILFRFRPLNKQLDWLPFPSILR